MYEPKLIKSSIQGSKQHYSDFSHIIQILQIHPQSKISKSNMRSKRGPRHGVAFLNLVFESKVLRYLLNGSAYFQLFYSSLLNFLPNFVCVTEFYVGLYEIAYWSIGQAYWVLKSWVGHLAPDPSGVSAFRQQVKSRLWDFSALGACGTAFLVLRGRARQSASIVDFGSLTMRKI